MPFRSLYSIACLEISTTRGKQLSIAIRQITHAVTDCGKKPKLVFDCDFV